MRIVYKFVVSSLALWVMSIWLSSVAVAQTAPQANLRGIVTDPSGARIPRATVQLRGTAGEQTQTSDANGQYAFTGLAPGRYDIQVTAPDFKTDRRQAFAISGTATLNVQLTLEGQAQVVNVQEDGNAAAAVGVDPDANASA